MAPLVDPDSLEVYRRELTGYCYRMLGSGFEADDAVQETMLRAWKGADAFEGRSSVRSWLYRIATNICLDMLRGRSRRALPMDLGPSSPPVEALLGDWSPSETWVSPILDSRVIPDHGDPAEIAVARDSVRLAFVTALQHLPARQRAALIMCEVLKMPAAEAAETLGTSLAAVNSALQRARATLAELDGAVPDAPASVEAEQEALLASYVDAFQRYDMEALITLLHDDAEMSMPPWALWLRTRSDIITWMRLPGPLRNCAGSRLVPVPGGYANGVRAWAQYKPAPGGAFEAWAVIVPEVRGALIGRFTYFIETGGLFPSLGLPAHR
jgi:RNA polymerase sigma-70 factor, ECF subfamily